MHWDWDWRYDHHWHRPWNAFLGHDKCALPARYRPAALTIFPWDCHHYDCSYTLPEWCHHSCLTDRAYVETGQEEDTCGKGTYKVVIDVHHFRLEELKLKVKNNDILMLEGQLKDDRAAKGLCIAKAFSRKYKLPRNYDATLAKATLSKDGILTLMVPAPPPLDDVERDIEIMQTDSYFGSTDNNSKDKALEDKKEPKEQPK